MLCGLNIEQFIISLFICYVGRDTKPEGSEREASTSNLWQNESQQNKDDEQIV